MIAAGKVGVGDTVLYHFQSYKRSGSSELELRVRPAIVTSICPDTRHLGPANAPERQILNLHVFFEDRDYVTPRQRDFSQSGHLGACQRSEVPPVDGDITDHRWSPHKPTPQTARWPTPYRHEDERR